MKIYIIIEVSQTKILTYYVYEMKNELAIDVSTDVLDKIQQNK